MLKTGYQAGTSYPNIETGVRRAVFRQNGDGFSDNVSISPDGKTLALWWNGGEAVYLWDIPPKKPWLRILAWSVGPVMGCCSSSGSGSLHADGRFVGFRSVKRAEKPALLPPTYSGCFCNPVMPSMNWPLKFPDYGLVRFVGRCDLQGSDAVAMKHWKKLFVVLFFASCFAAAVAWVEPWSKAVLNASSAVRTARFSGDGEVLVTSTAPDEETRQTTVQLWDVSSGRQNARIEVQSPEWVLSSAVLENQAL